MTVDAPYVIDAAATGDNKVVVNSLSVQAYVLKTLVLKNCKLGIGGGQTTWAIRTFGQELIGGQMSSPDDYRDEKMNLQGFIMPGALVVDSKVGGRWWWTARGSPGLHHAGGLGGGQQGRSQEDNVTTDESPDGGEGPSLG